MVERVPIVPSQEILGKLLGGSVVVVGEWRMFVGSGRTNESAGN
jgi:hypothetical protein